MHATQKSKEMMQGWNVNAPPTRVLSVVNQIEGPIITLRDGRNQASIANL